MLIERTGCINEQMKLSSWNTKGGKDKKQGHQAYRTLISSVGKYLATPIWSRFDLVETAGGHCCSPNFVKINKDAFLPPPHNPFQGIVVSVTGAFWPTVPSVSVSDFTVRPWPDLYTGLPRNLFNPSGIILKSSHLLEGCIFKITLTQNIAPEEQNMNSHRVSELYDQTRWGPPTLQVSCWPLIARLCLGLWICLESGGCCSGSRGVRHMWMCLPVPLPSPLIPCLIFNSVA